MTIRETFPTSNRDRRCDDCNHLIRRGFRYRRTGHVNDLWVGVLDRCICLPCHRRLIDRVMPRDAGDADPSETAVSVRHSSPYGKG